MGLLTIMLSFFYHNGNSAINLIYFQGKATLHYESSIKNEVHTERQKKRGRQKETQRDKEERFLGREFCDTYRIGT